MRKRIASEERKVKSEKYIELTRAVANFSFFTFAYI